MKSFTLARVHPCFFIFIFFIKAAPDHDSRAGSNRAMPVLEKETVKGVPYISNRSRSVVYYKPEDKASNPGLNPDGAYPLLPGEDLYAPFDGLVTAGTKKGQIFRAPTGAKVIITPNDKVVPANMAAIGGTLLLNFYGNVKPPDPNFAMLAEVRNTLYTQTPANDLSKAR